MVIDFNAGGLAGSRNGVGAGSDLGIQGIGYGGATVAREGRIVKGLGERLPKENLQKDLEEEPLLQCVLASNSLLQNKHMAAPLHWYHEGIATWERRFCCC